jgi:TonB family protein
VPIILAQAATTPPAAIAPAPPRPSVVTNPDWLMKPAPADFANTYPKAAASAHVEGHATMKCKVTAAGDLADCAVESEEPADAGFGAAALSLSSKFKMRPATRDGVPISGQAIRIPIRFVLPKRDPPSPELAMRCYGYSAAEAERNPRSQPAQMGAFAFGALIQGRLVFENARPSEVAEVLTSQRRIAADKIDDPKFKAERDECAVALPAGVSAGLQQMFGNKPR